MEGIISSADLTALHSPRACSHSWRHADHRPERTAGVADADVPRLLQWPSPEPSGMPRSFRGRPGRDAHVFRCTPALPPRSPKAQLRMPPAVCQHRGASGRTIHQGDHGGIPAQVQHFLQPHSQRAELAHLGAPDFAPANRRRHTPQEPVELIVSATTTTWSVKGLKERIAADKKVSPENGTPVRHRRPGQQSFVRTHARGLTRREYHSAPTWRPAHVGKIADMTARTAESLKGRQIEDDAVGMVSTRWSCSALLAAPSTGFAAVSSLWPQHLPAPNFLFRFFQYLSRDQRLPAYANETSSCAANPAPHGGARQSARP